MVVAEFLGTSDKFVFVGETSKNELTYGRCYGYSLVGVRAQQVDFFICGDRYWLAAALTKDGYIATHIVPGSFDSAEFYDFIVGDVVRYLLLAVHWGS